MGDVGRVGREDLLGDVDLHGVEAPGPDTAQQVRVAELVFAGDGVFDVAEGPVEREDSMHHAGVDHSGDRVVPQILLVGVALLVDVVAGRVVSYEVAGVTATDTRGLHAPVGREIGRTEGQALHTRRGAADLFDVGDAASGLENGVDQEGLGEIRLGLELGQQAVDVVDVFGALDLGDHDDVELVADLGDQGGEVVERPRGVERVHTGPELCGAHVDGLADLDEPGACCLFVGGGHAVFEVAEEDVDLRCDVGDLRDHLLVRRREEVNHSRRGEWDLTDRSRGTDGERFEEVLGATHSSGE